MSGMFRAHNSNFGASNEASKGNVHPKVTRANSKRPALGNVTNQLRIQPQRLAKGKVNFLKSLSAFNIIGLVFLNSFAVINILQLHLHVCCPLLLI